jgi:hypothetical protein
MRDKMVFFTGKDPEKTILPLIISLTALKWRGSF